MAFHDPLLFVVERVLLIQDLGRDGYHADVVQEGGNDRLQRRPARVGMEARQPGRHAGRRQTVQGRVQLGLFDHSRGKPKRAIVFRFRQQVLGDRPEPIERHRPARSQGREQLGQALAQPALALGQGGAFR